MSKYSLRWSDFRGPLSVTVACMIGMAIAMVDERYYPQSPFALRAGTVIGATLMLMDMSSAEKFYLKVFHRTVGTVGGVALGLVYSIIEKEVVKNNQYKLDWVLIVFRICLLIPTIFFSGVLGKIRPHYSYPLVVFAVQVPGGLFAHSVQDATGIALSSVCAVLVAVFSIVTFDNFNSESVLMTTSNKAIQGVLCIFQLAVEGRGDKSELFTKTSESVHKAINSAESSISTYSDWRSLLCKSVDHDFNKIVRPLKPLFYQSYTLFWNNTISFNAKDFKAEWLFCNEEICFAKHYKGLVDDVGIAIGGISYELGIFFSTSYHRPENIELMFDTIIESYCWHGLVAIQRDLRAEYAQHRKATHTSFSQRWNMANYLRQFGLMTVALFEYIRSLTILFDDNDKKTKILLEIDRLSDAIDDMRKNDHMPAKISK